MKFELLYNRHSIRLTEYDYTNPGGYFVTVCVQDRECLLGDVKGEKVELSETGNIVAESWLSIPGHFASISIDISVIMPNHIHGIIKIEDTRLDGRGEVPVCCQEIVYTCYQDIVYT